MIRSIAVSKTSDLTFGAIEKPISGSGSVSIDAVTGSRTLVNAVGRDTPLPTRATFNITGEGGQAFSVTVPATFTLNGPQPLTATTSSSNAAPTLSGTLG